MSENDQFKTYHGVVIDRDQLYTKLLNHENNNLKIKKLERLEKDLRNVQKEIEKEKRDRERAEYAGGTIGGIVGSGISIAGLKNPYATARISYAGSKAGKQAGAGIERVFDIFMGKSSDESLQKRENLLKNK